MLTFLSSVALATEPATLRAPPPSGADLEQFEGGWRWQRDVEIDGALIAEEGLATAGRTLHLRWTGFGKPGERLLVWQERQQTGERCPSAKDRQIALGSGILFFSYTRMDQGEQQVFVEQRESPYATCADIPASLTGIIELAPERTPPKERLTEALLVER